MKMSELHQEWRSVLQSGVHIVSKRLTYHLHTLLAWWSHYKQTPCDTTDMQQSQK